MKFKRPLVLVLVLALAMSAVTGGTIAWFTDEVTSDLNTIEAGNLDIELYVGTEVNEDKKIEAEDKIFDLPTLWEPGAVAYENVTIANEGNLYLDYRLGINFGGQNYVVEGDKTTEYDLTDVLKVAMVKGGINSTERTEVLAAAKNANGKLLADSYVTGTLAPKASKVEGAAQNETDTYGLVIYWEPTANDNNWNVNNGKTTTDGNPLSINLGVKVTAAQADVESDAFGNDYDSMSDVPGGIVNGDSSLGNIPGVEDPVVVYGGSDPMDKEVVVAKSLLVADELAPGAGQIAVTNIVATIDEAAVVLNEGANNTVFFQEADLYLNEGAYIVENNSGDIAQVIFIDSSINGTVITEQNKGEFLQYFKNVEKHMISAYNSKYNSKNTDTVLVPANVDKYSQTNAPLLSNKNASALVYANQDYVTDQNFAYITAMPDSDAVNVYNASISAKNVFVTEVHSNFFIEDASFTIPEGGKLIINNYKSQVFLGVEDITINGKAIKTFDDLKPYLEGPVMDMGTAWNEYNVHNTEILVDEDNLEELTNTLPEEYFASTHPQGVYVTGTFDKDTVLHTNTEIGQLMVDKVKATIDNDNAAIVLDATAGNVYIFDCEFTIPEGGKILVNNAGHCTMFVNNVKVNGVLLDSATDHATVEKYFEGDMYLNATNVQ